MTDRWCDHISWWREQGRIERLFDVILDMRDVSKAPLPKPPVGAGGGLYIDLEHVKLTRHQILGNDLLCITAPVNHGSNVPMRFWTNLTPQEMTKLAEEICPDLLDGA